MLASRKLQKIFTKSSDEIWIPRSVLWYIWNVPTGKNWRRRQHRGLGTMFPAEAKIIIVDDILPMRKLVRKCLNDLGLKNTVEANDGDTAWPLITKAQMEGAPFQLIISDWDMPKLTGIDLLRKVRADAGLMTTPFILLTAEAEATKVREALAAGVSSYIVKPFTPQAFSQKLTAVANKK
jgi:two-component system chemotaxis response regulator CheY